MQHTTNYNLPLWEAGDAKTARESQNEAMSAVDAALQTVAGAAGVELATGTYAGTGTLNRLIALSFTPRAVFVIRSDGLTRENQNTYGGLALPGTPVTSYYNENGGCAVEIVEGGFQVSSGYSFSYFDNLVEANQIGKTYHYIAIR